jgi:hypothetical protein
LFPGKGSSDPDPSLSSLHIHIHIPVDELDPAPQQQQGGAAKKSTPLSSRPTIGRQQGATGGQPAIRLFLGDKLILGGQSRPTGRRMGQNRKLLNRSTSKRKQEVKKEAKEVEEVESGQDYADFGAMDTVRLVKI